MVYSKYQALSPRPSPRKKSKASTTASDTSSAYSPGLHMMSDQTDTFNLIHEMLIRCNTMIAMNTSSIKDIEEKSTKDTATTNENLDALLHYVKALDCRLEQIELQINIHEGDTQALGRAVGTLVDTAEILENRIGSVGNRVSSIERLIVRSRKRKLSKAGGK